MVSASEAPDRRPNRGSCENGRPTTLVTGRPIVSVRPESIPDLAATPDPGPSVAELDTIVSLAKRRGFVYPRSEIYGGIHAVWDY